MEILLLLKCGGMRSRAPQLRKKVIVSRIVHYMRAPTYRKAIQYIFNVALATANDLSMGVEPMYTLFCPLLHESQPVVICNSQAYIE